MHDPKLRDAVGSSSSTNALINMYSPHYLVLEWGG